MTALAPDLEHHSIDVLYPETTLARRIGELAAEIARDYKNKPLTVVALLRGSFMFAADLMRALAAHDMRIQVEFMTLSSYGKGTQSSGKVQLVRGLGSGMEGRHVLLLDDILETGNTLAFAMEMLKAYEPASVKLAVLLDKPGKLKHEVKADYIGFTIEDEFVVGYGLDWAGYYRELPYIGIIRK
jgi:hypoxanthine phosphoribosyltransferase